MKKTYLIACILLSFTVAAQNRTRQVVTEIKVKSGVDSVSALRDHDNGLRLVPLTFIITSADIPARQTLELSIVDFDSISSKPHLIDSLITISSFQQIDATHWEGGAICNFKLTDSSRLNEKFYLVKTGDISRRYMVKIKASQAIQTGNGTVPSGPTGTTAKAKTPVKLDNASTLLQPIYIKDSVRPEKIIVRFLRDSLPDKNDTDKITLVIQNFTFPFKPKLLSTAEVSIKNTDWNVTTDSSGKKTISYTETLIINNQTVADNINRDLSAYVRISGNDESFHEMRLTERAGYHSRPFWMETGANFDLLDGIKANNLYAGIYMFEKDIARVGGKRNLGFTGGVYESKSSSFSSGSDSGFIYRDGTSYNPIKDPETSNIYYRYYRDTGSITTTTDVQSIGIFFSPHLRLTDTKSDDYGFHMYASLYLELLWQRVNSDYNYSKTGKDSVFRVSNMNDIYAFPFKEHSSSSDFRSQYIGFGFPIYITDNLFSLYINDVFGACNQRFVAIQDTGLIEKRTNAQQFIMTKYGLTNTYQNPKSSWNPFYLLQFRLTEETYGLVFTGEVRGFFLRNTKPVISLSLSKKFDLAELFKTIVKPFTPGSTTK